MTDRNLRRQKKVSLSLLWHLTDQKKEINTYVLSTYESHSKLVAFMETGNFKEADVRLGLTSCRGLAT